MNRLISSFLIRSRSSHRISSFTPLLNYNKSSLLFTPKVSQIQNFKNYSTSSKNNNENVNDNTKILDIYRKIEELQFYEKFDEAIKLCDQLLVDDPKSFDALLTKSQILITMEMPEDAMKLAKEAIDANTEPKYYTERTDAPMLIAQCLADLKRTEEAAAAYVDALKQVDQPHLVFPSYVLRQIYTLLATVPVFYRECHSVIRMLERCPNTRLQPVDLLVLGILEERLGNHSEAIKLINRALSNYIPTDYDSETLESSFYRRALYIKANSINNDIKEQIELLKASFEQYENFISGFKLASIYYDLGQYKLSYDYVKKSLNHFNDENEFKLLDINRDIIYIDALLLKLKSLNNQQQQESDHADIKKEMIEIKDEIKEKSKDIKDQNYLELLKKELNLINV